MIEVPCRECARTRMMWRALPTPSIYLSLFFLHPPSVSPSTCLTLYLPFCIVISFSPPLSLSLSLRLTQQTPIGAYIMCTQTNDVASAHAFPLPPTSPFTLNSTLSVASYPAHPADADRSVYNALAHERISERSPHPALSICLPLCLFLPLSLSPSLPLSLCPSRSPCLSLSLPLSLSSTVSLSLTVSSSPSRRRWERI